MAHPNDKIGAVYAVGNEIVDAPYVFAAAISPSDSVNFSDGPCRAIWVGTTGNAVVIMWPGAEVVTFNAIPSGTELKVCATRVNTTSTTASNMVALY